MSFWLFILATLIGIVIGSGIAILLMYNDAVAMHNLYKDLLKKHNEFQKVTADYIEQLDMEIEELKKPGLKLGFPSYYDDDHDVSGLLEDD
jgi:hypothetical protein